jgi:hypothetical protein
MYQIKVVEKIKTHILLSFFLGGGGNRDIYEIMWKNILEWSRTDDNMAHVHCMLDT